ncbi:AzlD family protein [Desulfovibrio inopinatus]|uniref:AzlD family protein n=1 Tax=Desulfovibrio inopinatus TaxID=102109 RepID=UPI000407D3BC|nr:AzlD domain-containing protein [Desulfovibrio inopinatus]
MLELSNPNAFWAIACAAFVTYGLRLGGLLLATRLPRTGRLRRGMDALPGALLFSLVLPSVAHEGIWGIVAAALTAAVALKTRNVILAMLIGMAVIFVQRQL